MDRHRKRGRDGRVEMGVEPCVDCLESEVSL